MALNRAEQHKKAFLEAYAQSGVVVHACKLSGVGRTTVYVWRENDPEFAAAYQDAEIIATEVMEAEMYRRAVEGVEKPIYQNGKRVGEVREYSDTLLIFALKAHNPAKYRENKITVDGTLTLAQLVSEVVASRES